ncbi:MAG: beta-galactosidase, partial [Planctomycetia bacterium]|nr:beta-galactosidase [Planctomycetia bacterium]
MKRREMLRVLAGAGMGVGAVTGPMAGMTPVVAESSPVTEDSIGTGGPPEADTSTGATGETTNGVADPTAAPGSVVVSEPGGVTDSGVCSFTPVDHGGALLNPDMGWTMHYYSNITTNYGSKLAPSDTLDWFEGCSTIYLRLPWAYLEPEEGVFNWSIVDGPAQRWIAKGRKIAFRFTTSESWLEYATPEWVEAAGAEMVRYRFGEGPTTEGNLCDPVYDDPIFLEKLERFLAAAGARYNGNPDVAFIDVGTFGTWGEGHTFMASRLSEERNGECAKIHADLHRKYFPDVQLCISDDVIGHNRPGADFPLMEYFRTQNISLRDDSILVQPEPNSWYHAELAQKFWPEWPVILEHEHLGGSIQRGAWNDELLVKAVEDYHASYMSIHWWPQIEWEKLHQTVRRINRRMGYRIQLRNVTWPETITVDEPFEVTHR